MRIAAMALLALACGLSSPGPAAAQNAEKGKTLFTACASCHGADGRSTVMKQYPKIGGQNEAYLVSALKAYRDGKRQGGFAAVMAAPVKPLSDEDIKDVASYVSKLGTP